MSETPRKSANQGSFPPIGGNVEAQAEVKKDEKETKKSPGSSLRHVRTRFSFPVYVPTQQKVVRPGTICPIVIDDWVQNQLSFEYGSLILED